MRPNAIVVCVNFYDILEITLKNNRKFFDKFLVITSKDDLKTKELVKKLGNVDLYETNSFYGDGCSFNKGKAMEEGFDVLGRKGWICILDADILIFDDINCSRLDPSKLYSAPRRMVADINSFNISNFNKQDYPLEEFQYAGYLQLFNASDHHIKGKTPWYETTWKHAGGCDSFFQFYWLDSEKINLGFEVIHLGNSFENWHGRATPYIGQPINDEQLKLKQKQKDMMELRQKISLDEALKKEKIGG